ncbi:hypothetical protein RHGRI_030493 [Rhododendron griersonianum]|uniref:Succinate dehydrogenase subunit 4 n=1 Tax=Rhododendron griersonianum TaxID=479676 RepID=A0AAV6IRN9_9ERIC|nr:hypothetical protein RHGRI_030493 [Rhododendron griersonianum]
MHPGRYAMRLRHTLMRPSTFFYVLSPYVRVTQLSDVNAFLPLVALWTLGSFCLVQVALAYFDHGGILHYVITNLLGDAKH